MRPKASEYFADAVAQLTKVLAADPNQPTARTDLARLQRMETLGWDEQYAACEKALRADPRSAMANLLFATYPSQWNQDKLDEAGRLRSVRTWYTSDVKLGINVIITTTYKNFSYPGAAEIAGAEQVSGEAQQMQIWASTLRDRAMKLEPLNPMVYFLTGRVLADRLDLRDRIACDGLLADPGNAPLHSLRRTYEQQGNSQPVSEAIASSAVFFDGLYDSAGCAELSRRLAGKDAFSSYCAALQAVRLAPADAFANLALASAWNGWMAIRWREWKRCLKRWTKPASSLTSRRK